MKKFFQPNITRVGRIVRGALATGLLVGGIVAMRSAVWLGVVLLVSSAFVFFEAFRGWCVVRACGIKTKL